MIEFLTLLSAQPFLVQVAAVVLLIAMLATIGLLTYPIGVQTWRWMRVHLRRPGRVIRIDDRRREQLSALARGREGR